MREKMQYFIQYVTWELISKDDIMPKYHLFKKKNFIKSS